MKNCTSCVHCKRANDCYFNYCLRYQTYCSISVDSTRKCTNELVSYESIGKIKQEETVNTQPIINYGIKDRLKILLFGKV